MTPIFFGLIMAAIDVLVLSLLKMRYVGDIASNWIFVFAFLAYGMQTIVFYKALGYSNLTNMNLIWDLSSDILVTIVGIYFFKEAVTFEQKIGIALAVVAILLLK